MSLISCNKPGFKACLLLSPQICLYLSNYVLFLFRKYGPYHYQLCVSSSQKKVRCRKLVLTSPAHSRISSSKTDQQRKSESVLLREVQIINNINNSNYRYWAINKCSWFYLYVIVNPHNMPILHMRKQRFGDDKYLVKVKHLGSGIWLQS